MRQYDEDRDKECLFPDEVYGHNCPRCGVLFLGPEGLCWDCQQQEASDV